MAIKRGADRPSSSAGPFASPIPTREDQSPFGRKGPPCQQSARGRDSFDFRIWSRAPAGPIPRSGRLRSGNHRVLSIGSRCARGSVPVRGPGGALGAPPRRGRAVVKRSQSTVTDRSYGVSARMKKRRDERRGSCNVRSGEHIDRSGAISALVVTSDDRAGPRSRSSPRRSSLPIDGRPRSPSRCSTSTRSCRCRSSVSAAAPTCTSPSRRRSRRRRRRARRSSPTPSHSPRRATGDTVTLEVEAQSDLRLSGTLEIGAPPDLDLTIVERGGTVDVEDLRGVAADRVAVPRAYRSARRATPTSVVRTSGGIRARRHARLARAPPTDLERGDRRRHRADRCRALLSVEVPGSRPATARSYIAHPRLPPLVGRQRETPIPQTSVNGGLVGRSAW
jgi:hypothetical protein